MKSPCDCHTCLAVGFVRAWATNIREAIAKAPRDEDGKASAFTDVGLAEANDMMLEDNADLLEEVADQLELDRHLPPDAVAEKHTARGQLATFRPRARLSKLAARLRVAMLNRPGDDDLARLAGFAGELLCLRCNKYSALDEDAPTKCVVCNTSRLGYR